MWDAVVTVAVGAGAGLCIGAIAYAVKTRTGNGEERGEPESREWIMRGDGVPLSNG